MGKAPDKCPMCGEKANWKLVDETKRDLALEKPQLGQYFLARLGLWAVR